MLRNKLKLNQDKNELLLTSSNYRPRPPLDYIRVGEEVINLTLNSGSSGKGARIICQCKLPTYH